MDIRYKLYPYPVLSYYSDDYVGSSFDVIMEAKKDGYDVRVDFLAELDNPGLQKSLDEGIAKIVYHIECAQTGYRKVFMTSQEEYSQIISYKKVCGRVQICPFIVAIVDLNGYVNDLFHEDYRGFRFDIDAGCVMAVGRQVNIDIDKEINDLSQTPSVFSIIKNDDETEYSMLVNMDNNKIVISLPETDYYNYRSIKDGIKVQPILNSIVIIPALIYVLEEVASREVGERDEYNRWGWYRAIKKALTTSFSLDIEAAEFSECDMFALAQKLINVPLSEALKELSMGYGIMGEEDEE